MVTDQDIAYSCRVNGNNFKYKCDTVIDETIENN